MFNTEAEQQYQNLFKLQDTIEEHHSLRTHLNVIVSDLYLKVKKLEFCEKD